MASIGDSKAIFNSSRILPQHQSALTMLNGMMQNPTMATFHWLDLACGKGQIISQLKENLSINQRQKLSYMGYDINIEYTREAAYTASTLHLKSYDFHHGDLSHFNEIICTDSKFDFITCTNTAHELQPGAFSSLIISALLRLKQTGELFLYDMESLTEPELGALPWHAPEVHLLINTIFEVLGTDFRAEPSTWSHFSCKGWSITIKREHINKTNDDIQEAMTRISAQLEKNICRILQLRYKECNRMLKSYHSYGAETKADKDARNSALFEFWFLTHALEDRK